MFFEKKEICIYRELTDVGLALCGVSAVGVFLLIFVLYVMNKKKNVIKLDINKKLKKFMIQVIWRSFMKL